MATVEEVRARLTADVGQFTSGFQRASATVLNFNQTATSASRRGANILRGALTGLTLEAAGASGAIGRLATGMATFAGIGATPLIAILAPLAGIAIGFKRAAAEAKKFFDELQVARNRQQRELTAIGAANLTPDEVRERLKAARDAFAATLPASAMILGAQFETERLAMAIRGELGSAAKDAAQEVAALEAALVRVTKAEREAEQEFADAQRVFLESVGKDLALIGPPEVKPFLLGPGVDAEIDRSAKELALKIDRAFQGLGDDIGETIKRQFRKGIGKVKDDVDTWMRQMGQDAVRSLVAGIIEGTDNLFDLLANIFKQFLIGGIVDLITGGPLSKMIAGGATHGQSTEIPELSPAMVGAPSFNVTLPPARTPFDQARDADWQRALRESIDVAVSQGYRR